MVCLMTRGAEAVVAVVVVEAVDLTATLAMVGGESGVTGAMAGEEANSVTPGMFDCIESWVGSEMV